MSTKPNKAGRRCEDPESYSGGFPCYLSPKFDGYRATIQNGEFRTYTGKLVPNKYLQTVAKSLGTIGKIDGELTVGDNFQTSAEVMQINPNAEYVDFRFHVFDMILDGIPYQERLEAAREQLVSVAWVAPQYWHHFTMATNELCESREELIAKYHRVRTEEGAIARSTTGVYEPGKRSKDIWKIKPYRQAEAKIIGYEQERYGENLKTVPQELWGTTKERISSLIVIGEGGEFHGQKFNIGTGFSHDLKSQIWENRDQFLNKFVTFKYIESGSKDRPRHPVFHGFRSPEDFL